MLMYKLELHFLTASVLPDPVGFIIRKLLLHLTYIFGKNLDLE